MNVLLLHCFYYIYNAFTYLINKIFSIKQLKLLDKYYIIKEHDKN